MPLKAKFSDQPLILQLLAVFLACLTALVIFSLLGAFLAKSLLGVQFSDLSLFLQDTSHPLYLPLFKLFQGATAFGLFIAGGWWGAYLLSAEPTRFTGLSGRVPLKIWVPAILLIPILNPFIGALGYWNFHLPFPEFLHSWRESLMHTHSYVLEQISLLASMDGVGDLIVNLLVLAFIPALGEELLFRGVIQGVLYRRSGAVHLSVWVAALGFGMLHNEPFNLLPLVVLGAMLGYVRHWSGSLWPAVAGHFINNAGLLLWLYFGWADPAEILEPVWPGTTFVFASLAGGMFLLWLLRRSVERP